MGHEIPGKDSGPDQEKLKGASDETQEPSFAAEQETASDSGEAVAAPKIGSYQLLQLIGEGGMGEVWLADQKQPVRRRVAIKLIKAGMDTREVVARFESERQALALMDHPAIAKVFDAGSTADGRPYFVMEYVAGRPITTYCDRHKLNTRERLALFMAVCEGVQHAHQKAIIHRDLKPSNILVTEVDGKPAPRIIDFGVAKATAQRLSAHTMYTQMGATLGTLGYMSPEQADSGGEDIDTRSDVYSLGVVLYELLSGSLPFDFKKLAYDEVLRRLREEDAPRPSTRLRTSGGDTAITAKNRGADAPTLVSQLKGDPDAITLKALEKDRGRRYATPSEMALDIGRYLRNEPVLAHAPSVAYRTGKYVRRHRLGVALAGSLVLMGIVVTIVQAVELRRIRQERDRADRITDFMTNMFKVSSPSEARGNKVTAREILDKSSNEIDKGLGQDAEVRTELMRVMATTYENLGLYGRAHALMQRVLDERRSSLGETNPKTLAAMTQMGMVLYREGRDVESEKMTRAAIDLETRKVGKEDPLTLEAKDNLAIVMDRQAHYVEMEKLERENVAIKTRRIGADNPQTLRSLEGLGEALAGQSRFAEAEQVYLQLLSARRRLLGDDHPDTLITMHNLANAFLEQGDYAQAEKNYRLTLEIEKRVLGPDHPDTGSTMTTLANTIRFDDKRYPEAEDLYRKADEVAIRVEGPDSPNATRAEEGLANLFTQEKRYVEAEKLLSSVLAVRMRQLGPDHTDTLISEYNLADVEYQDGQYADAERGIQETLKTQVRVLDANDPDTFASRTLLAKILLKEHRLQEAEQAARGAYDAQMRILGPEHRDTLDTLFTLGTALNESGRYDEARGIYLATIGKIGKPVSEVVQGLWFDLGCLSALSGRPEDAFDALGHAIDAGYRDTENMRADEDLKSLHGDTRFKALLSRVATLSDRRS